jgi:hypothetical protein
MATGKEQILMLRGWLISIVAIELSFKESRPSRRQKTRAILESGLDRKLIPADEAKIMLPAFVEKQLQTATAAAHP